MFVGHEFLAFALGAGLARLAGTRAETALAVGIVAGASALLPDLDLLVGAVTYSSALGGATAASWEGLWGVSNAVHRGVSHTVLGGLGGATLLLATALGWRAWDRRAVRRALLAAVLAATGLGALLGTALLAGGGNELVSVAFVGLGTVVVGTAVATRTALSWREILGGALVGFLGHPYGDVFMAAPPTVFYPLDVMLLTEPIRLAGDPTLNLLGITGVELAAVWAGLLAYLRITDVPLHSVLDQWAVVGLVYPAVMLAVPRPTMVDAHWLGFTIAPFAGVGLLSRGEQTLANHRIVRALATGLATITFAAGAYALAYLGGIVT